MEKHLQSLVGNSYWTRNRHLRSNISRHIAFMHTDNNAEKQQLNTCFNVPSSAPSVTLQSDLVQPTRQYIIASAKVDSVQYLPEIEPSFIRFDEEGLDDDSYLDADNGTISTSDDEISSDDNDDDLGIKLHEWSLKHGIILSALHDLLFILKRHHPHLPSDPRTLRGTPRSIAVKNLGQGGSYYHFGIAVGLRKVCDDNVIPLSSVTLSLQFNIDGIPIFRSTSFQLWPILMIVKECNFTSPITVGLYGGNCKPVDLCAYLSDFVTEMQLLLSDGIALGSIKRTVTIHSFVCDAPARSFLKSIKPFNAYSGCERCMQVGLWKGRVTYPETNAQLRTDCNFDMMTDEDHHSAKSPLQSLGFGMISKFPLDYICTLCVWVL